MKRLRILILAFCLAVSIPLAFVIWQTYQGLEQEESAQLRFFSEALLDKMEAELAGLVQREENRTVDEYNYRLAEGGTSPLAAAPREPYILGYLQNNPDGSFQTPLVADPTRVPPELRDSYQRFTDINNLFNQKKFSAAPAVLEEVRDKKVDKVALKEKRQKEESFAGRYLAPSKQQVAKAYLGRKQQRTEQITANQAINLSKKDASPSDRPAPADKLRGRASSADEAYPAAEAEMAAPPVAGSTLPEGLREFQVEVAPLQSVFINQDRFFIFRRIAIDNQIFRQGFILDVVSFAQYLANTFFAPQPMARFSGLRLKVTENGRQYDILRAGAPISSAGYVTGRTFPAPFHFLSASVEAAALPASPARHMLTIALFVLGLFMLLGLIAIYHSARVVVELSERRSQFVSSVTHELKTPLTNIRLYIEMLEQGIAATPDRERDYFQVLGSEGARLSRLINNVLELSKLEKKQRHFDLQQGDFQEVLTEVKSIMSHKMNREGFELETIVPQPVRFVYDREVMIQVLINLMENSIKFGGTATPRRITIRVCRSADRVHISVADTGPGIPPRALKKVFDDFYRVDNDLTRTSGGTGIGLALVKKFVTAMGGSVSAANNKGPGCTITLSLPV